MSETTPNFGLPLVPVDAADPAIPVNDSITKVDELLKEFQDNSSIPTGGNVGDFLAKGPSGYVFVSPDDLPKELPAGGSAGQVLVRTSNGYAWANPPTGGSAEYPAGGSVGQVLKIVSVDPLVVGWANDIVGTGGGSGGGGGPSTGTAHRAWRVRILDSFTGNSAIDDIQFRSVSGVAEQPSGGAIIASGETIHNKEQVFDNDTHSSSYPGWATAGLNGWVGYDYVTPKEVVEVRLRGNFDDLAKDIAVDFTDDPPNDPGANWTTVIERPISFANFGAELVFPIVQQVVPYLIDPLDGTSGDVLRLQVEGDERSITFGQPKYNRVRVSVLDTRANTGPGFAEIKFFDKDGVAHVPNDSATNQALGGYPLSNSYDGVNTSFFTTGYSNFSGSGPWYGEFIFADAFALDYIEILPRQDGFPNEVPVNMVVYGRNGSAERLQMIAHTMSETIAPGGTVQRFYV